jgi:nitronate monooxygenase
VVRTDFTQKILEIEEKGAPVEEILPLISGEKVRAAYETGDTTNAVITAGQTVGLIHDIPSVQEIIDRIISEAQAVLKRVNAVERG